MKTTKNNYNVAYYMLKDFDKWNSVKKKLDASHCVVDFAEKELWWCSIGLNVGSEQHSSSKDFSRPVVIVRKFTRDVFIGVPVTTKIKEERFRYRLIVNNTENDALLMQLRVFDRRRLIRKICVIDSSDFIKLKMQLNLLFNKTKTPFGVFSEASDVEANVCSQSIANEISLSNELNYLLSRGEISYSEIPLK